MGDSNARLATGFCEVFEDYYPISNFLPNVPQHNGILLLFSGFLNCIMSIVTIYWIKVNEFEADNDANTKQEEAIRNVIFPVFVKVLWLSAIINVYAAVVTILIPQTPNNTGSDGTNISFSFHYAMMRTLQHSVVEGIAFLLMQKGCGKYANKRAFMYTATWGIITFATMFFSYGFGGVIFIWLNEAWNILLFLFYAVIWLTPQKHLFRRPAAIKYCQFWAIFRFVIVLINVFYMFSDTENLGACGFIFVNLLFLAIVQPVICYWTLKQDSRWWQGIDIVQGVKRPSTEGIRSPLIGTEFDLSSAQSLAVTLDQIPVTGQVKMLNFASLKLDMKKMLGSGSFSKVYRGTYRGSEVAIKLIYTADLTTEIIMRVAAEASILSSIRHPNVVHIVGLSVLPPSVCLILEICSFGSLSDIIRGYGFDWNATHRSPLTICRTDAVYLALGCARGLAAVHAYDSSICHRDVKSFNFLVDAHFNVKIADLELGVASQFKKKSNKSNTNSRFENDVKQNEFSNNGMPRHSVDVQCLLGNWLAPEVLIDRKFIQASDIYSLGTVMWEIISKQLPFASDSQLHIHIKIREGYKHPMPNEFINTPLAALIEECWEANPQQRPTGSQIVERLEVILNNECFNYVKHIEGGAIVKTTPLVEFYESHYKKPATTRISEFMSPGKKKATKMNTNTYIDISASNSRMTKSEVNNSWTSLFRYDALAQDEKEQPPSEDVDNMQKLSTGSASANNSDRVLLRDSINFGSSNSLNNAGNNSNSSLMIEEAVQSFASADMESGTGLHDNSISSHNVQQYLETSSISTGNTRNNKNDTIIPQLPRAALDVIGIVKEEGYWTTLNSTGQAWAVVTTQYPHVVIHATGQWFRLFGINQMMSSYSKLVSLVSLAESFSIHNTMEALETGDCKHISGSNMYVNESANVNRNTKTLKAILKDLKNYRQVHSVLSFHVSNKQAPVYQSSRDSSVMSGYNMMCTMHAYPVHAVNQYTYNDTSSSTSQRRAQDNSPPIYFAMLFSELKEQAAIAPEVNLSDGVGNYNSKKTISAQIKSSFTINDPTTSGVGSAGSSSVLGRFFSPSTLYGKRSASHSDSRSNSRSWSKSNSNV